MKDEQYYKMVDFLRELAKDIPNAEDCYPLEEDFNPSDWSGGNYDDCFAEGFNRGENDAYRHMGIKAKELLDSLE